MIFSNTLSRMFGYVADKAFPPLIQKLINTQYVKRMGLDMSEFADPGEYSTLNALFTRKLQKQRTIQEGMISSVDAFITKAGPIMNAAAFQIKGMEYDLRSLLGRSNWQKYADSLQEGEYANFYLSPKDYHRYHVPFDLQVHSITHIPGALYPVNFTYLNKIDSLFNKNERVVLECEIEGRWFFIVLVGALNVGKMVLHPESDIQTNRKSTAIKRYTYKDMHLKKGDELGYFKMGSTVLFLAQKGLWNLCVHEASKVRFGQKVAEVVALKG